MDICKTVGSNIRRYRMAAGISQEELAARMGFDQGYVSKLEAGHRNPTLKTIECAALALSVSWSELFAQGGK